jgi:hypothetical protein
MGMAETMHEAILTWWNRCDQMTRRDRLTEGNVNLDFYRDLHKQEFARSDSLATRSNAIVAGLTTLGGVIGFLVVGFKASGRLPDYIFWSLTIAAGLAVSVAVAFLIAFYAVKPLRDLEKPSAWRQYLAELTAEYKAAQGKFTSAEAEFEYYVIATYAEATDQNIAINTARGYHLIKSNFAMIAAFVLVVSASLSYYYANSINPRVIDVQEVAHMLSNRESLVCVPTGHVVEAATAPGTRPVPGFPPPPAPPPPAPPPKR